MDVVLLARVISREFPWTKPDKQQSATRQNQDQTTEMNMD